MLLPQLIYMGLLDHIKKIENNMKNIVLEKENFHTQRNNKNLPQETCNVTSCANFIEAAKLPHYEFEGEQLEDSLYRILQTDWAKKHRDLNVYWYKGVHTLQENIAMLSWAMNIFCTNIFNDPVCKFGQIDNNLLINKIKKKEPVLILGDFIKGKKNSHYVTVIGNDSRKLYLADPWGDHNTNYKEHYGYCTELPIKQLDKFWSGKYAITLV